MRLKEFRVKAGLTQQSLADKAGMAREIVTRIETGRVTPELPTLIKLADVLGCTIDELVGRDKEVKQSDQE